LTIILPDILIEIPNESGILRSLDLFSKAESFIALYRIGAA